MPKKPKHSNQSVEALLEKTRFLLDNIGKPEKASLPCRRCKNVRTDLYRGVCGPCRVETSVSSGQKRAGQRWTSPDGYVRVYDSDGKPQLYARVRMAQLLGRSLTKEEFVTYLDRDRGNVSDENLVLASKTGISLADLICPCCGKGFLEHANVEPTVD